MARVLRCSYARWAVTFIYAQRVPRCLVLEPWPVCLLQLVAILLTLTRRLSEDCWVLGLADHSALKLRLQLPVAMVIVQ